MLRMTLIAVWLLLVSSAAASDRRPESARPQTLVIKGLWVSSDQWDEGYYWRVQHDDAQLFYYALALQSLKGWDTPVFAYRAYYGDVRKAKKLPYIDIPNVTIMTFLDRYKQEPVRGLYVKINRVERTITFTFYPWVEKWPQDEFHCLTGGL